MMFEDCVNNDKSVITLQEYLELAIMTKPVKSPAWEEE